MKLDFIDFNRLYFERLLWLYSLLSQTQDKSFLSFWEKEAKNGIYSILIFDNYKYYTGAIIERLEAKTIKVICPYSILNITNKPVHWKKYSDKYFDYIKTFYNLKDYSSINLCSLDLIQLIRIINSKEALKTFFNLSYNGVIYTELHYKIALKLKLKFNI